LFGFILICVQFLGNRCVKEVSSNSNSNCDHDVSTESEWRGPGRVPVMYGTVWGWWPQFFPLHVWLPGEYTLVQVWLFQNPCNHAVMGLIFYEVLIYFLIWLSVHSPNKGDCVTQKYNESIFCHTSDRKCRADYKSGNACCILDQNVLSSFLLFKNIKTSHMEL
jgi:hypothetical protein